MARRARGEGAIVKRKDGLWQASLQAGGKRQTVYGKTQREAAEKLEALRKEVRVSTSGSFNERHTLGDLISHWLSIGESTWAPRTQSDYQRYSIILLESLGENTPLTKLAPARIQVFLSQHKGSPRKAQLLHQAIHTIMALAVQWDWLSMNPVDRVDRPVNRRDRRQWWTVEQCRLFLDRTQASRWWPLWSLALATGCRLGELSALRWTDISVDRRTIRIGRSGQYISTDWVEKGPKTEAGYRTLPLNALALAALEKQQEQQSGWKLRAADTWQEHGLVFTSFEGRPLRRFDVAKALRNTVRRLGLPTTTMHGLRHLSGSLALAAGASLPLVSRYLGHSNPGITARVYLHAVESGTLVAEALDRVLGPLSELAAPTGPAEELPAVEPGPTM